MDAQTKLMVEILLIKGGFSIGAIALQMRIDEKDVLEIARSKKSLEARKSVNKG